MSAVLGLSILVAFYAFAYWLVRRLSGALKGWRWKWLMLAPLALLLVVLPWADEIYITYRFAKLCEDAGVHVVRKVEVEGFLEDMGRPRSSLVTEGLITDQQAIQRFDERGYRFQERMLDDGRVSHVERVKGGLQVSILDRPIGRYVYKYTDRRQEIPVGYQLEKREIVVVDSETGEILGRDTRYNRYPGWVEGLWVRFFGSGQITCLGPTPDPSKPRLLDYHVFVTTNKN